MIGLRHIFVLALLLLASLRLASADEWPPVNCDGITDYPHLKDWNNNNPVDPNTIYLLNLYYSTSSNTDTVVEALVAGMRAALEAHAYTTEPGSTIVVVDVDRTSGEQDAPEQYIAEALCRFSDRLFGVLGPFHDNRLRQVLDTNILRGNNLVALGPYTGSSTVRFFTKNTFFMRADPVAEIAAMLNYIVNHELHRRVGYAFVENRHFGDSELLEATEYVERVGSEMVGVYRSNGDSDAVDMDSFQQLVDSDPQSIIVFCSPGAHAGNFLTLLLKNEKLKESKIFVPSFLNYELEAAADAVEAEKDSAGAPLVSAGRARLLSTSTSYPASDTSLEHIVVFRQQMTTYIANHPGEPYDDASIIDVEPEYAELMINGWIVGQMILQIFYFATWSRSREALMEGLFSQNRFIIESDFVLGDYGGVCRSAQVALQGATCECNQGGSTVFLMQHNPDESMHVLADWVFSYSSSVCFANSLRMPIPVNLVTMNYEGSALFERIDTQLRVPGQLAVNSMNTFQLGAGGTSYNIRVLHSAVDSAQVDLDHYIDNQRVDIIIGPVLLAVDTADTLILSPTYQKPHVTFADMNKVVMRATLEQQFYVACDFLTSPLSGHVFTKGSQIRVVLRDVESDEMDLITEVTKKTTVHFRHQSPKVVKMPTQQDLDAALDKDAVTFFVGLRQGDCQTLVRYLESSPKGFVLILFQDVMMYYDELVEAFAATSESVRGRLVFASNFPMWNDDSAESYAEYPILESFHTAMEDAQYYTPRAFEMYITARVVDVLASSLQTINAKELREQLYHTSNFLIDDFRLGPYTDCDATRRGSTKDNCELRNYGANDISIVSMSRIITPSQHKIFGPVTPDMVYTKPLLTTGAIVAIAVCGGLAVIAMIVVPIVVCMCCCNNSRDNKNAPKDSHHPVTVIFTDIESSTALWGTVPQIMPDAVAAHHKLIREIIAAHKSYEVKTVGDSFMIACKRPFAAVQIAQDIQKRFLAHDWDAEIDECYRQFEQRRAADPDNESYAPHSANLVRDVYEALWRGLRVRIGVHTGLSDIRQDEITGGFDYYGETSNMAARTEAIGNGGQVLLTDATWWALSQAEREALQVTSLGHQPLRGVSYPVEMYQLCVAAGRQYPPLRLDVDAYLPNDDATDGGSMATDDMASSSAATLTGPSAAIATVLTNCFSPYPAARRIKELQPLLQKWGIPVPPRHRRVAEDDYCQGLINRLALKMSSVVQLRSKLDGPQSAAGSRYFMPSSATPPPRGTSAASGRSLASSTNPLVRTRDGLTSTQLARLRVSSRMSHRSERVCFVDVDSAGQCHTRTISSRASSTRGTPNTDLVEMFPPSTPNAELYAADADLALPEDREAWLCTTRAPSPLMASSPGHRRSRVGLAALSTTSEANSSVHVAMPAIFA